MADLVQASQVEFYKQRLEVNMSAILQGADKAYLREYNESEDERRLDALQDSIGSIRKATKGGKYLGSDVLDIMLEVQGFAEKLGIDPDELAYAENQVREAQNNLESAIYGLEEPFEDAIRTLQNRIDDVRMDAEDLDEAGTNCWKGYEKKGTKKMFGKTVNNCVKKESVEENTPGFDQDAFNNIFKDRKPKASGDAQNAGANRRINRSRRYKDDFKSYKDDFKRNELDFELGHEDLKEKKKSGMGEVMEMYDDHLYLMYINGKLAAPTPIERKDKNTYERIAKNMGFEDIMFKATPRHHYSSEDLAEGNGNIRKVFAGIVLLGGLLGLNNYQAQKMYDQSHQLQQLTQVYMVAKDRGDKEKMKDVSRRISNHKTRIDLGKGDVDFDGRPGNDDIKDIDYINPIEER